MNKKAQLGHGITWLWKFMILVLVVGCVVAIVASHYSKPYDIRYSEAETLSKKLIECIAPNGILTQQVTSDMVKNCFLINDKEMFLNLTIDNKQAIDTIGLLSLSSLCEAKKQGTKMKYYPACLDSSYIVLKQSKMEFSTVKISIAINKVEKNI